MQFQLWTNHNNGTTGVINTLTQQVLTETTAFTFNHLSQRFQWTLVRASHGFAATTVIEQGVNCFLQHTLFVACDNFWCAQFHQALQTVLRLITRRYKSFRSEVAKRPPSSGTNGRNSGGNTGNTSMIIQSGLIPERWNASSTFKRLAYFLILASDLDSLSSVRRISASRSMSIERNNSRIPSAPINAVNSSPCSSYLAA